MNPSSLYEMRHSIVQAVSDYVDIEAEELVEVGSCSFAEITRAQQLWPMQCSWVQTVSPQCHLRTQLCCCECLVHRTCFCVCSTWGEAFRHVKCTQRGMLFRAGQFRPQLTFWMPDSQVMYPQRKVC